MAIVKGAGLIMRALIEEGEAEVAAKMQNLALSEGALPRHLLAAFYTRGSDGHLLTLRQLSRHLIGLWVTGNPIAMSLLKRIMVRFYFIAGFIFLTMIFFIANWFNKFPRLTRQNSRRSNRTRIVKL